MISRTNMLTRWWVVFVLVAVVTTSAALACSSQSPNIGKFYKGRILHISIAAMERTDELRWTTSTPTPRRSSGASSEGSCVGISWHTSDGDACFGIRRDPSASELLQDVAEEISDALQGTDGEFYRLVPESPENELILLRVKVENHTATTAAVNVDEQSAQLRDFLQGRYFPINVGERAESAGVPEKPGDHCTVPVNPEKPTVCVEFLWNQTFEETQPDGQIELVQYSQQLPQGSGLDGWMVFEVPQGTMIRSFRWGAGDTVTIDF